MQNICEWCGRPISEVGRLRNVRDWESPNVFGERRGKARIRKLCEGCKPFFEFQSGISIKNFLE